MQTQQFQFRSRQAHVWKVKGLNDQCKDHLFTCTKLNFGKETHWIKKYHEEQRSNKEIIWGFVCRYRHMFKWHKGSFILTQKCCFFCQKKRIFLTFIPPRSGSLKPLMHFSDKSVRRKKLSFFFLFFVAEKICNGERSCYD
jgi:hypothetical protein